MSGPVRIQEQNRTEHCNDLNMATSNPRNRNLEVERNLNEKWNFKTDPLGAQPVGSGVGSPGGVVIR